MKHQLSFAHINFLDDNIIEVIVNDAVEVSIEMVEEYDHFLATHFSSPFGILVNKINNYAYSYEAQWIIASHQDIAAMAVVYYDESGINTTKALLKKRAIDNWNLKAFNALELGWQSAIDWLKKELAEKV